MEKPAASSTEAHEEHYRAIVETLAEGVLLFDEEGRALAANPSALEALRIEGPALGELTLSDPRLAAVGEDGSPLAVAEHPAEVTRLTGEPRSGVIVGVETGDGERAWLSVSTRPVGGGASGAPYSVVASFIDISGLIREEDRLRRRIADSEERELEAGLMLAHSLLPERLPTIPGVAVAARHIPVPARGSAIAGDFYDAFRVAESRWLVVIGDVSGKGPEAASLTALARYTLRAESMYRSDPAELLALLNGRVLAQRSDRRFLTAALASLDVVDEGVVLTVAVGGHPRPLVLRADGRVEQVGFTGGLLGVVIDPKLAEERLDLGPGDSLVLYTDGVLDARAPESVLEAADLAEALGTCRGLDAETIATRIEKFALAGVRGEQRDDIALVVLQLERAPG